jgi:bacterial/archaeal transporter family-2 protein
LNSPNTFLLVVVGVIAGCCIAVQSVLNATLSTRIGSLGSLLVITLITLTVLILLILAAPETARLNALPPIREAHLYFGGVLGVLILASIIVLVPRIGTTSTLVAIVLGQLAMAVWIDHFGLLASPRVVAGLPRLVGLGLVLLGTLLVTRSAGLIDS